MFVFKKIKTLFFWILLLTSDTTAQILLKIGADRTRTSDWMVNSFIIIGYSTLIISFIAWMQILKTTRLSIALAISSILYITIAFASYFFMGEPITRPLILGTLLITFGVCILGFNEGKREDHQL